MAVTLFDLHLDNALLTRHAHVCRLWSGYRGRPASLAGKTLHHERGDSCGEGLSSLARQRNDWTFDWNGTVPECEGALYDTVGPTAGYSCIAIVDIYRQAHRAEGFIRNPLVNLK